MIPWVVPQPEERSNLDYRAPTPGAYETTPTQQSIDATPSYSPDDWDHSNADWAAFVSEIKAKMTDTDDALVEWAEAQEGFTSAVSRRRSK